MVFCTNCGAQVTGAFCSECGTKASTPASAPPTTSATGNPCAGCGKPLSGRYVSAMESKWHSECFKCSKCNGSLGAGFFRQDGKPVCTGCQPAQTVVTTVRQPGFTIDPRTGQKKFVTPKNN